MLINFVLKYWYVIFFIRYKETFFWYAYFESILQFLLNTKIFYDG
jgi:hypothetical protein